MYSVDDRNYITTAVFALTFINYISIRTPAGPTSASYRQHNRCMKFRTLPPEDCRHAIVSCMTDRLNIAPMYIELPVCAARGSHRGWLFETIWLDDVGDEIVNPEGMW